MEDATIDLEFYSDPELKQKISLVNFGESHDPVVKSVYFKNRHPFDFVGIHINSCDPQKLKVLEYPKKLKQGEIGEVTLQFTPSPIDRKLNSFIDITIWKSNMPSWETA